MARKTVKFRRIVERKTDYKARLALLKGGFPRFVVRKTNKYIIIEVVESREAKDFAICYANSKELKKYGWNISFKNIPASYLTGFLAGVKAKKSGVIKAVADLGLQRSTRGSKLYAAVKGAIDAGLEISCSKDIMPGQERIEGKHLKQKIDVNKIKEKISQ